MSYDMLERELRTLPEKYITEISRFVSYLKMKEGLSEFEQQPNSYKDALYSWRDSAMLFFEDYSTDIISRDVFKSSYSKEMYTAKEIW